jgi:hypothetical protein
LAWRLTAAELPELVVSPTNDQPCIVERASVRRANAELDDPSRQRHRSGIRCAGPVSALTRAELTRTVVTPTIDLAVNEYARVSKADPDLFGLLAR